MAPEDLCNEKISISIFLNYESYGKTNYFTKRHIVSQKSCIFIYELLVGVCNNQKVILEQSTIWMRSYIHLTGIQLIHVIDHLCIKQNISFPSKFFNYCAGKAFMAFSYI